MSDVGRSALLVGDSETALAAFTQAVAENPRDYSARYGLAAALMQAGQPADDVLNDARTLHALSIVRGAGGDVARLTTDPEYARMIGVQLYNQKHVACASVVMGMALSKGEMEPLALVDYALSLQHQGRAEEAVSVLQAALEAFGTAAMHEFLLYALFFVEDGVRRYAAEARTWAARYAAGLAPREPRFQNQRTAQRRLRIGYVGPNFTRSQLRQFIMPVLENHDPASVEMFLYCIDPEAEDALPSHAKIRAAGALSDEALAERIRADRIDILVDLWGHASGSRMGVFARKPAPVQVAWVNFVQTTGLSTMDYVLHCDSMETPGTDELFVEKIWRTGVVIVPYRPAPDRLEPTPTPALASGRITFGSYNHPAKLSDATVAAWCRILHGRPGSRLVLKYAYMVDPVLQRTLQARFAAYGVEPERIEFRGASEGAEYLASYQEIDLALDPSPCPGGTTTCDALANGVPVLTLRGEDFYSRIGLNTVIACGLPELIAESWDDYVQRALDFTADAAALDALRARVRPGFEASPFRDEAGFVRRLEDSFREMFERWAADAAPAPALAARA